MSAVERFTDRVADDQVWARIIHGSHDGGWTVEVSWKHGTYDNGVTRFKDTRVRGADLGRCCQAALDCRPKHGDPLPHLTLVEAANGVAVSEGF